MRKVTFGGAITLDNFIASKDDSVDWILSSKETGEILRDYFKTIDTIVMGWRTYEVAARQGPLPIHKGVHTYVFSRTLKERTEKGLTFVSEDVVDFVRRLKEEEGKDICIMGGGMLAKPLFEAGLIDEIRFNIHPVLLGSGIPLYYEMKQRIDLELVKCQPLSNGCVLVTYRTKHARRKQ